MAVDASVVPVGRVPRVQAGRLGLSVLVVLLLLGALVFVAHRLVSPADGTEVVGFGDVAGSGSLEIASPSTGAVARELESGDRVLAMLGRPVEAWAVLLLDPAASRPVIHDGDAIVYTVARDGGPIDVTVTARPFDPVASSTEDRGVLLLALTIQVVGIYLYARRPGEPAAQALLVAGTAMFASTIAWALGLQATDLATATGFWSYALLAGLAYALFWCGVLHLALVFPRPYTLVRERGRLIAVAYLLPLGSIGLISLVAAVATGSVLAAFGTFLLGQSLLQVIVIVATVALMGYSYLRLVDPTSRLQLRWVAGAVALAALSGLLLWFGPELIIGEPLIPRSLVALLALPFPVALAIAINHHHLFDLDKVVNRSLVYGGLTVGVLLAYGGTVALIGGFIPGNAPYAVILLGAGVAALAALPLRDRLQGQVDRLMYGDRDDPARALRRLGRRLERSLDPQTVLPTLVEAVAEALRVPYVAIEWERDGEARIEAAHGSQPIDPGGPREPVRLPIVYRGLVIGELVVVPRAQDEPFSAADEALLADLARQAAPAVEAVRLTADLRRSREELVATREEERRRLRRDLHDEIGPALAGSLMKLGAARSLMASEPDRAGALLEDLEADAHGMIDEIRRMARDLRPPALDELGLTGALRQRVATFDAGVQDRPMRVTLEAPDSLPSLPAAVEVAAMRIALEGLTNASRHSGATHAAVGLCIEGDTLVVSVTDDGVGIAPGAPDGIGLGSMRERADELGGSFTISTPEEGGTSIVARLPVTVAGAR